MEPDLAVAVADALSIVVLLASVAALLLTASERETRELRAARPICALASALLVASSLIELVDRWALVVSCMAFLASVQAMALKFGYVASLQSYLDRHARDGEGAFWDEFERGFARHVARRRRWARLRRARMSLPETPAGDAKDRVKRSGS